MATRVFVELVGLCLWGGINPTIRKHESNNVVILSRVVTHGTYVDTIQMALSTALRTEMQENTWARLRESHAHPGGRHAT